MTGRVYLERNNLNLYSNILDCPDFFWEAETFEPLYRRVNTYLDIEDRVRILNNRRGIEHGPCADPEQQARHRAWLSGNPLRSNPSPNPSPYPEPNPKPNPNPNTKRIPHNRLDIVNDLLEGLSGQIPNTKRIPHNRLDIVNDLLEGLSGQIPNTKRIPHNRLDIVNDLLEGLSGQIEIRNSHRLEIIVIALIAIEILLELLKEAAVPPLASIPSSLVMRALRLRALFGSS